MRSLHSLEQALRNAGSGPFHGPSADTRKLDRAVSSLRTWLGAQGSERPREDAIALALLEFYRTGEVVTLRQARLVCFGCLTPLPTTKRILIEDDKRFPVLLTGVDGFLPRPRAYRLCYRGLLYAYFGYNPDTAEFSGRENWQSLRAYLRYRADHTLTEGALPDWVESLRQNLGLLDEAPGVIYGAALLEGQSDAFDNARRKLDIREDSWLIWRLVLGQIDAAARSADAPFQNYLPRLLALLEKHPLARQTGLKRILERYHDCQAPPVQASLRDFAVASWGNPWLSKNNAQWSLVRPAARTMVEGWLKLVLIQQFFSLLAADGTNDKRRLRFWERYHNSIDDMYFALGSTAYHHRGKDFQDLRQRMAGRLLALQAGGSPDNNAFIMCIGNYVVVEFGIKGNACYVFRRNTLPFDLSKSFVSLGGLKHRDGHRLLHQDSSWQSWEDKFQAELSSRMQIAPVQRSAGHATPFSESQDVRASPATAYKTPAWSTSARSAGQMSEPQTRFEGAKPENLTEQFSIAGLMRLCQPRKLAVQDFRDRNGNLWVIANDRDATVNATLRAWGFAYKADKGWWRK